MSLNELNIDQRYLIVFHSMDSTGNTVSLFKVLMVALSALWELSKVFEGLRADCNVS